MGIIKVLDESVSNIIAAGEVVENPASMLKELLENSLDAESKSIKIEVKSGGRHVIISDDGKGMTQDDLLLSVERHATSKIAKKEDLYNLFTYGFRGEALSSISAVSKMTLSSRTKDDETGSAITVSGGKITGLKEIQRNVGTTIEIKDLFFNTPARLKFLRKTTTEYMNIKDIIVQEALGNPNTAITLILDDKVSIKTTGNGIDNTIVEIFGRNVLKNSKPFSMGYLGNASLYRATRDSIFTFVNGRMVKSKLLENAIIDGYYTKLMKGKYPFAILFLEIDPKEVDVNVHPSKKIVKFSNESNIYGRVLKEIKNCFEGDDIFVSPTMEKTFEKENEALIDFSEFSKFVPMKAENIKFEGIEVEKYPKTEREAEISDMDIKKETTESNEDNFEKIFIEKGRTTPFEIKEEIKVFEGNEKSDIIKTDVVSEVKSEFKDEIKEDRIIVSEEKNAASKIDFKVFGQIFDSFILVERDGVFEIYDQHIVHERILYEKLKKEYYGTNVSRQQLLVPIRITLDPRERELIFENIEYFTGFGFEIDEFDENEVVIRSVPVMNFRDSTENIFKNIIKNLKENKETDIRESIIISMSCKGAIKANEKLSLNEMETIIRKLHEIGEYTCPHGRPIIVKITLNDLEKLFKRK
ncbi:DNA mismatch repair endonuclease MutL [Fusobacterium varium]|uniref:DNA mismatch repair endonuclease MutL n=1 Tax=Fusobacterium varium TaxID=856 RepID=UPI001F32839E|nr:DNA mismatch repair endonuclease MutL [Fusobacterium varium]MCF2672996.1 DNA mismatch repair endonuclease MutL [Fusobacterium varium]